jgi:hypothetical protein
VLHLLLCSTYAEWVDTVSSKISSLIFSERAAEQWLRICDPMQMPIDGEEGWTTMKQVYYNG